MINLEECKTLKEVVIKLYGKYHGRNKEKAIKYIESQGISYKDWINDKHHKKKYCLQCGEQLSKGQNKFCSSSCSATYNNNKRKKRDLESKIKTSKPLYLLHNSDLDDYKLEEPNKCKYCGKQLNKHQSQYCSNKCYFEYNNKIYLQDWKLGNVNGIIGEYSLSSRIRKYLLSKHNYKCECCGWGEINPYTNTIPLEIHHKDGNYKNNDEENLQVLCPNCHSLTETTKSHNKNGRKGRSKYYKK